MPARLRDWGPALVLAAGILAVQASARQRSMPLRRPLADVIPLAIGGYAGSELEIPEREAAVAGMTTYLSRAYRSETAAIPFFTLYIGYYDSQTQGHTIHSPRNCLPGAGWESLQFETQSIETAMGRLRVARYLVRRGEQRACMQASQQHHEETGGREREDQVSAAALEEELEHALERFTDRRLLGQQLIELLPVDLVERRELLSKLHPLSALAVERLLQGRLADLRREHRQVPETDVDPLEALAGLVDLGAEPVDLARAARRSLELVEQGAEQLAQLADETEPARASA